MTFSPSSVAWWDGFRDNLEALNLINNDILTRAGGPLVAEHSYLVTEGAAIQTYIGNVLAGSASQYATGLAAISGRVAKWLQDTKKFSEDLKAVVTVTAANPVLSNIYNLFTGASHAEEDFSVWLSSLGSDTGQAVGDLADAVGNTARSVVGATTGALNSTAGFFDTIGKLPWAWIGVGVAAIFLLPKILEALEED